MAGTASIASSSHTSTSHTLTAGQGSIMGPPPPASAAASSNTAADMEKGIAALLDSLAAPNRHTFLLPPASIPAASLLLAKQTLDAFAAQVGDEQQRRLSSDRRKRKRNDADRVDVLKMRKLHVQGFDTAQVWQQARRIIGCALSESRELLAELEESGQVVVDGEESSKGHTRGSGAHDGNGLQPEEASDDDAVSDEDSESSGGASASNLIDDMAEESDFSGSEGHDGLLDERDDEVDEMEEDWDDEDQGEAEYIEDPNGLNDGFFSIDDFNKQTQWLEEQDARADPNTDQVSDEESLDWHVDPYAAQSKTGEKSGKASQEAEQPLSDLEDDDEDANDDDGGPTFGDMELDAPEGESEDDELENGLQDGLDGGLDLTADDIFYKDFFAPPPRKANKNGASRAKQRPAEATSKPPDSADMERAINDVRRDLFDDLSSHADSDEDAALSDASAGDPKSRRSAHERRQAKLAAEIRRLEAASIAQREWTLAGEAAAADRPINSLLAEDLDFEHAGKPAPVVTQEVSEDIEALIKRRILAGEFDEVRRRRPDSVSTEPRRRGLVELDDGKPQQSLAQIYEEEHTRATTDGYVAPSDERLAREEAEVARMWKDVCARLDALSSWHYRPRPAEPALTVVADVAAVSMEDAQPATALGVGGAESMLAPQEVYRPGEGGGKEEVVVRKSGLPVARAEMSREEKRRRRRREKERVRKGGEEVKKGGRRPLSGKAKEQKETVGELKRAGVRVINRKGEIVGLDGKKESGAVQKAATSASFKL